MKKNSSFNGFTLIELLLVIVILSLLMTFGFNYYRQRTISIKVDKTVLQVQQLMQAANTYYQRNGQWPIWPPEQSPIPFRPYIPVGVLPDPNDPLKRNPNPWGGETRYRAVAEGNKFQVLMVGIPSNVVEQIIARLPSANIGCTDNQCTLYTETTPPLVLVVPTNLGFLVKVVGETGAIGNQGNITLPAFSCPPAWVGSAVLMLNGFFPARAQSWETNCLAGQHYANVSQLQNYPLNCTQLLPNSYSCTGSLIALYSQRVKPSVGSSCDAVWYKPDFQAAPFGSALFTYIGFCMSPKKASQENTLPLPLY